MRARSVVPFCLRSFLVGLFLFSVAWTTGSPVARSADDQEEIGVWRCALAKLRSCPPDGEGRGPEDFWTFPLGVGRKLSVSCEMTDNNRTERCVGVYLRFGIRANSYGYGARLTCPTGYVRRSGQCVEVNPPRADKKCSSPAGSPVNAATGRNDQTVVDWSGPPPAARSSSATTARSAGTEALLLQPFRGTRHTDPVPARKRMAHRL